jgi:molybdopterin converting factor small subunit
MRVNVLYFGVLKDVMGRSSAVMGFAWDSIAVAVNQEYARADCPLKDEDEVALLPPVSGGAEGCDAD